MCFKGDCEDLFLHSICVYINANSKVHVLLGRLEVFSLEQWCGRGVICII